MAVPMKVVRASLLLSADNVLGIVLFLKMIFSQYSPEFCDVMSIIVYLHFMDEKAYLSLRDAL